MVSQSITLPSVPPGVYDAQLNGIQEKLKTWLTGIQPQDPNNLSAEDDRVGKLLKILGVAWPFPKSRYPDPNYRWSDPSAPRTQTTATSLLLQTLRTRGKAIQGLSHSVRKRHRSIFSIEEDQEALHRYEFTRLGLEFLAGFCLDGDVDGAASPYRDLEIKVLVVDNCPKEIFAYNELLPVELGIRFWKNASWYVVSNGFDKLRNPDATIKVENLLEPDGEQDLELSTVDIILQDYSLGPDQPSGLDLAKVYLDYMPQALVFLTTGLPIETITATGGLQGVDRVIRKSDLAALPWYYHLAFTETLGSMFWDAWLAPDDRELGPLAKQGTLQKLLGSIRRWQNEPEILWHGQALPEMVDHGHPHISDLWRFANEILGARNSDLGPAVSTDQGLTTSERVILALGIWLHDVGHRGDEYCVDAASIRDVHGSISERLLLRYYQAFGLGWLLEVDALTNDEANQLWGQRNEIPDSNKTIPAIRLAGLLCRHHQSSAPLIRADVGELHFNLKFASDYARTAWRNSSGVPEEDVDSLSEWRDQSVDLDWLASDIRSLEEFAPYAGNQVNLMKCGCLLRLLDAMHVHRCRAGSKFRIKTHRAHLEQRQNWVHRRIHELENMMSQTPAGSQAYLAALQERFSLENYYDLLGAQEVHLWRQAVVTDLHAGFSRADGRDLIDVTYEISEESFELPTPVYDALKESYGDSHIEEFDSKGILLPGAKDWIAARPELARIWLLNLLDDVLKSELRSQCFSDDGSERHFREQTSGDSPTTYLANQLFDDETSPGLQISVKVVGADDLHAITVISAPWGKI